jgi:N-acetylglucosamine-6-phosphate deacetylase
VITAFQNGRIVSEDRIASGLSVLAEDGRIAAVVPAAAVPESAAVENLEGGVLLPGFIDVQVNGGGSVLFNQTPTVAGLAVLAKAHARLGTTGLLATLISSDLKAIAAAIKTVDEAIVMGIPGILGIHIEGPYLSPARRGIHNPAAFTAFDDAAFKVLTSLKHGKTLLTLAPEAVASADIAALVKAGVIVSLGHSDATYEEVQTALQAGARGFTHLFNAMSPLAARAPGVVGAALVDRDSWCGIIADGRHVHPAALRLAYACRGPEKLMLVSDAMPVVGCAEKTFTLQGRRIRVENGVCVGPDGTLAGAAVGMDGIFRRAMEVFGVDLASAAKLASGNAAAFLGLSEERGQIAAGARADFVLLDEKLEVRQCWINGVPQRP